MHTFTYYSGSKTPFINIKVCSYPAIQITLLRLSMFQSSGGYTVWTWEMSIFHNYLPEQGHKVARLVEALCHKPEDSGFDSR
jgi:hypothetical protein